MEFDELPDILPIFPLKGVLLLPGGQLPLNIFEPRYLAMINAALRGSRLIGMVQPQSTETEGAGDDAPVYKTGCAGRIVSFEETDDGRYLITLKGVSRFLVAQELGLESGFRRVSPDWRAFAGDLETSDSLGIDRHKLTSLLETYFSLEGLSCNWEAIDNAPDNRLITCLAMVCPFEAREKQALLEAECGKARASLFITMLEIAICGSSGGKH